MFLPFFKPVTFSFDIYRGTMVENSVKHSCSDNLIMEYLTPITIRFIRGKNNRSLLISFRHKLEKTMSPLTIKRQISHLIDYQQFVLSQNLEFILKYPFTICLFQSFNKDSCIGKIN